MNQKDVRVLEAEIVRRKAALEHLSDEGCYDFELDYAAGTIHGLTLALNVTRAKRR
jgi:hypothetical protein